jgi:aromatic-L-amino-acid/L-tryptophan decarboxylase
MSPEDFRLAARAAVDLIADYWANIESRPVLCPLKPGDFSASIPAHPPEHPEPFAAVVNDINAHILPALTHWQSPNFFGFFPANASFPAILGELLSAGLGVQGMLWATSPACTELETRVLDWLAEMIGLPASFQSSPTSGGVLQGTASEATLVALLAARHRALSASPAPKHLTLYTSTQAHSSVIKAAMIAGLALHPDDRTHLRLIPPGPNLAMRADLLDRAIRDDLAAGRTPCALVATLGTTSSTAIDPLAELAPIARAHNLWLHVDAAFSGAACVCPEHRAMLAGVQHADSFSFNPHKWLLTNFDCAAMWTRDRAALAGALSITPEYLRSAASSAVPSNAVIDYRDWQIPLGRRFRALKLWMVIRHYGVSGLQSYIREHIRLAQLFESLVRADHRFELAAQRTSALVCFRLAERTNDPADADRRNRDLLTRLNSTGKAYLTHTVLPAVRHDPELGPIADAPGRFTLRMAIGSTLTQ